jgi:polar amino acid transport system substrate-binding protein
MRARGRRSCIPPGGGRVGARGPGPRLRLGGARGARHAAAALAVVVAVLLAGCGIPRDPEGTLDHVRGGTLRVGISQREPWTRLEAGRPSGVEVRLVERFATQLGATVRWVDGAEADLVAALEVRELDLVVAGLTSDTPWQAKAAITRGYATTRTVVAVPADQPVPDDLAGLRVAVEAGTEAAGILEDKTDAVPVRVPDATRVTGTAVVVDDWELDRLGLKDTGVHLKKSEHVMAAPLGENAFVARLERFLIANQGEVPALLAAEARAR